MTACVAICGGGALAHTLAGVTGAVPGVRTIVISRQADRWSNCIAVEHGDCVVLGAVAPTSDPRSVSEADLVLIAAPAFAHADILRAVAPYLRQESWIGALPAIGGFDQLVRDLIPTQSRVLGSLRSPYNARVETYGRRVRVSGVAPRLDVVATGYPAEAAMLARELLGIPTRVMGSFVLATVSAAGTIFHPARIFELLRQADPQAQRFYADWGDAASEAYLAMDAELGRLRRVLGCDPTGLDAQGHYGVADSSSLTRLIRALPGLPDIPTPFVGREPDPEHRFLREDLSYGLARVLDLARQHSVQASAMLQVHTAISAKLPPRRPARSEAASEVALESGSSRLSLRKGLESEES
jgi:hypothetical protein